MIFELKRPLRNTLQRWIHPLIGPIRNMGFRDTRIHAIFTGIWGLLTGIRGLSRKLHATSRVRVFAASHTYCIVSRKNSRSQAIPQPKSDFKPNISSLAPSNSIALVGLEELHVQWPVGDRIQACSKSPDRNFGRKDPSSTLATRNFLSSSRSAHDQSCVGRLAWQAGLH